MAHKKAGGSSRNGRDSDGRRLGVKKFGGEQVVAVGKKVHFHGQAVAQATRGGKAARVYVGAWLFNHDTAGGRVAHARLSQKKPSSGLRHSG